jgi:hypothetical protein
MLVSTFSPMSELLICKRSQLFSLVFFSQNYLKTHFFVITLAAYPAYNPYDYIWRVNKFFVVGKRMV